MRRGHSLLGPLFLTLTGLALAQETTPEPAWPTETPAIMPTPSETPSPAMTLVPTGTDTPFPAPTETATLVPSPVLELPTGEILPFDDEVLLEVTEDVGSATPSETPTLTVSPSLTASATPTPTPTAFYYLGPVMTQSGAVSRDGYWYVFGIPTWLNTLNAQAVGIVAVGRSLSSSAEWKVMTILGGTPGVSLFSDNPDNVPPVGGRMIPEAVPMVLTVYPGANVVGWPAMLAAPGTPSGVRFEFRPTPANPGLEWVQYRWVLRGWPTPTPVPTMTIPPTPEPTLTPTSTPEPTPTPTPTCIQYDANGIPISPIPIGFRQYTFPPCGVNFYGTLVSPIPDLPSQYNALEQGTDEVVAFNSEGGPYIPFDADENSCGFVSLTASMNYLGYGPIEPFQTIIAAARAGVNVAQNIGFLWADIQAAALQLGVPHQSFQSFGSATIEEIGALIRDPRSPSILILVKIADGETGPTGGLLIESSKDGGIAHWVSIAQITSNNQWVAIVNPLNNRIEYYASSYLEAARIKLPGTSDSQMILLTRDGDSARQVWCDHKEDTTPDPYGFCPTPTGQ